MQVLATQRQVILGSGYVAAVCGISHWTRDESGQPKALNSSRNFLPIYWLGRQRNLSQKIATLSYLEAHARRIYSMSIAPEREAALILAKHIKKGDLPNPFTAKNVYDKTWQLLRNKEEVETACRVLEEENWLLMERQPKNSQRGRPLIIYHINPKICRG